MYITLSWDVYQNFSLLTSIVNTNTNTNINANTNTKNANSCFIISVSADLPRQLQIRGDLPKWDAGVSWTAPIGGKVIKDIMLVQFICLQPKSNWYLGKEFAKNLLCSYLTTNCWRPKSTISSISTLSSQRRSAAVKTLSKLTGDSYQSVRGFLWCFLGRKSPIWNQNYK